MYNRPPINLSVPINDKSCLILFNSTISFKLDTVYLFATLDLFVRG